jgi:hypothetical protein
MRRVISRPATVVMSYDDGEDYMIYLEARITDEHQFPTTVELDDGYSNRMVDIGQIDLDIPGMLTGVTAPSGYGITIRPVEDDDCVGMMGMPDFPCPAVVVGAIIAGENMDTHIEAMVESDGFVSTLMLVTDVGLWLRYSSGWIKLNDVSLIDGLGAVNVEGGSVDLYDAADRAGKQLPISSLPGSGENASGPYYTDIYVAANASMTFTEPVTASMATVSVKIDTVRDLPGAVEAAASDESIRWYVERRARALDPEYPLPWRDGEAVLPLTDPSRASELNGE